MSNPPSALANAAVFIFSPEAINIFSGKFSGPFAEISLDFIPIILGKLNIFNNTVYHRDIGTLASLEQAQRDFEGVYRKFNERKSGK